MNITDINRKFPDRQSCVDYLEQLRWGGTPQCPYCQSTNCKKPKKSWRFHCNSCNTNFSVLVGTVMQASKIDLRKWFLGTALVLNAKKGIASRQLARDLGVTKDTAWYLQIRIRFAMEHKSWWLKPEISQSRSKKVRAIVAEAKSRRKPAVKFFRYAGSYLAKDLEKRYGKELRPTVIFRGRKISMVGPDSIGGYFATIGHGPHLEKSTTRLITHSGPISEKYWNLLQRGLMGQYHRLSARYVYAYITEFRYRFENREANDLWSQLWEKVAREPAVSFYDMREKAPRQAA